MNTTLGGLFSSRINMNLREKHGYTYGASSAFLYRRGPGPFLVGTSVRTDVTAPAVTEILNEIEQMRSREILPVLVVEGSSRGGEPYLARALSVSVQPRFDTRVVTTTRLVQAEIDRAAVIVLNDAALPAGTAGRALEAAVNRGTGLLLALGERASRPEGAPDLLPGSLGGSGDRRDSRGGTLGFVDLEHPVFEVFRSPRSGDLTAARVFRYRQLAAQAGVLARFDDGAVAVAERRVGRGRVIAWTSTLDGDWNDLVLKPVFVPLLHQAVKYLAGHVERPAWHTTGDAASAPEMASASAGPAGRGRPQGERVALSPSGARVMVPGGQGRQAFVLNERGFYEFRSAGAEAPGRPAVVAVNVDPGESNLAALDPSELASAVTRGTPAALPDEARQLLPEDRERRQSLWWYMLALAVLALAAEGLLAGRCSRAAEPRKVETTT